MLRAFARLIRSLAFPSLVLSAILISGLAQAQLASPESIDSRPVANRLTQPIDEHVRLTLARTVHPLARASNDRGLIPDSMKLDRMQILLKRSDPQEAALKQLLHDLHTPGSAKYHQWLTPEQFGQQFGPSDADIAKLEGWLQSHGFSVTKLNPGRQTLEFSGSAGQFRDTFRSSIHSYGVNNRIRYANSVDPQIPAALAPVFGGFVSLNNFSLKNDARIKGSATYNTKTHATTPSWTVDDTTGSYYVLSPADFAVQYDLNPLYNASSPIKGDGQSIAIVNDSNIDIAMVNRFRTLFNLPVNPPQVIIDGNDPGIDGTNDPYGPNNDSVEAYLDVEWAGAVAPNATVDLVIAADGALTSGLELAAERAVYSNIAPVISVSFEGCEMYEGTGNQFWSSLWEQAAAQGSTVAVAAGDGGSAGCDNFDSQYYAVLGQAVNGIASTPFNVAVGGTDFYYSDYSADSNTLSAQLASYWNAAQSNSAAVVSLLSPVPEQPWNGSQYGLNAGNALYYTILSGGGGASNCATSGVSTGNGTSCTAGWPKPLWQTGAGVPNDNARDLPDIALFASNGFNYSFYPICFQDGDCQPVSSGGTVQFTVGGGTSAATPSFAAIMALVNEKYGRQGQANYVLYQLASQYPSSFHDIVNGTNSVPCNTTTVTGDNGVSYPANDCVSVNNALTVTDPVYGETAEGQIGLSGAAAYNAGTGYDLASGLGSIDAANLVSNWGNIRDNASKTTLTPSSTSFVHGTPITVSGTVTGKSPTGDVSLMTSSAEYAQQGQAFFPLSGSSFSGSVDRLPGGTYTIWGNYPGDGNNSPSTSTPVSITVTPESSVTNLSATSSGAATAGETLPYGAAMIFSATSQSTNRPADGGTAATGTITFNDNASPIHTAVISRDGSVTYTADLPVGSHAITAEYSGDNSYAASTSSAVSFTVSKTTAVFNYAYFLNSFGQLPTGQSSIISVILENNSTVGGQPGGVPPSGTLSLAGGPAGATTSSALVPTTDPYTKQAASVAYFTFTANAPVGAYTLNFTYTGDNNFAPNVYSAAVQVGQANPGLTSSITASASATATSSNAPVDVTVTVSGKPANAAPTGFVSIYTSAYLQMLNSFSLPVSSTISSTVTVALNEQSLPFGVNRLEVYYSGDSNYQPSYTTITIDNSRSDFSLVPATTLVNVPSSGAINDSINITSLNGFTGNVYLTCSGAAGIACSITPSVTLTNGSSVPLNLTINTAGITKAGTYNVVVTGSDSTGTYVHDIGLQVVAPVTTGARQGPVGNLDLAVDNATKSTTVSQAHNLFVGGWASDVVDGAPLHNIKVYIDSVYLATPTVGISRPDVATYLHNSADTDTGFDLTYNAANLYTGPHTVVAIATDAAGLATTFGPLHFTVAAVPGPPLGNLDLAVDATTSSTTVSQQDELSVSGWIADPVDGSPLSHVTVAIDGRAVGTPTLGITRPDVAAYFHNNTYTKSGYHLSYHAGSLTPGSHTVTVTGKDSSGLSTTFGPLTFTVVAGTTHPVGNLEKAMDSVTGSSTLMPNSTLFVCGWAADYLDDGPAKSVQILIDGNPAGYATLGQLRPDVESYYGNPAWSNTGWTFNYSVASLSGANHSVTAIAKDSLGLTTTFGPLTFSMGATISTYAGNSTTGYKGDGGLATNAELYNPEAVAVDSAGNVYIADTFNNAIRKVSPSGIITTFAGGAYGYTGDDGLATSATLAAPYGVAIDSNGNVYIADTRNSVIRKIDASGIITTVAGNGTYGYTGDGGQATSATLSYPYNIAVDKNGNLYIADRANYVIRMVTPAGIISTVAGNNSSGYSGDGGAATSAQLGDPAGVAVDGSGNLYIADSTNQVVRKMNSAGIISTFAGSGISGYTGDGGPATSAELSSPYGLGVDNKGDVFITDNSAVIREVNLSGAISTVAGNGQYGYTGDGGLAIAAELDGPSGVAIDASGNLYISDTYNEVIRKVTYGGVNAGGTSATSAAKH